MPCTQSDILTRGSSVIVLARVRIRPSARPHTPSRDKRVRTIVHLTQVRIRTSATLTHFLGTSESARSYTLTNLSPRKKKLQQSQCQSSLKENLWSDVNMVSLQIPPSKMATKPRAVSLSPEDNRKTFDQHYPRAHGAIKSHADLFSR
jgi:hypothetical protein